MCVLVFLWLLIKSWSHVYDLKPLFEHVSGFDALALLFTPLCELKRTKPCLLATRQQSQLENLLRGHMAEWTSSRGLRPDASKVSLWGVLLIWLISFKGHIIPSRSSFQVNCWPEPFSGSTKPTSCWSFLDFSVGLSSSFSSCSLTGFFVCDVINLCRSRDVELLHFICGSLNKTSTWVSWNQLHFGGPGCLNTPGSSCWRSSVLDSTAESR